MGLDNLWERLKKFDILIDNTIMWLQHYSTSSNQIDLTYSKTVAITMFSSFCCVSCRFFMLALMEISGHTRPWWVCSSAAAQLSQSHHFPCVWQFYLFTGVHCEGLFDGWTCWPDTPAGRSANQPCPAFIVGFDPESKWFTCKIYHISRGNIGFDVSGRRQKNYLKSIIDFVSEVEPDG